VATPDTRPAAADLPVSAVTLGTQPSITSSTSEFKPRPSRRPANRTERRKVRSAEPRSGDMFCARESAESNYVLMGGMIGQTLAYGLELPGVADVAAWGLQPLTDPTRCSAAAEVHIEVLREPGARAALFVHEGVVYLYSMGSAATSDAEGDNAFIRILCAVLERYRPNRLRVATFSRLVRATEFIGRLYGAVLNNVDILLVGMLPIDLRTEHGRALWHVFSMVATMERDLIVARLLAGVVHKYQRGEWVENPRNVPLGYEYDPETRTLRLVSDSDVEAIRTLLNILGDDQLTNRECLTKAGQLGVGTANLRRLHGSDATVADARNARELIRTLASWMQVYQSGRVVLTKRNTFRGVKHVSGLPVHFEDEHDEYGWLEMEYSLDIPLGGWASEDSLAKVLARAGRRDVTGGQAHTRIGPLTGIAWSAEDVPGLWSLTGAGGQYYMLMLEPRTPVGSRRDPLSEQEADPSADGSGGDGCRQEPSC
jgi:DNA invertase Pin-like site-specific DNA recombinase